MSAPRKVPGPGHCETPEKRRFYVLREARVAAQRCEEYPDGKPMRIYQCGMHFHLTSTHPYRGDGL